VAGVPSTALFTSSDSAHVAVPRRGRGHCDGPRGPSPDAAGGVVCRHVADLDSLRTAAGRRQGTHGGDSRPVTAAHDVALLRLVAQRIAGPPVDNPAGVVHWMTAMQAQDFSGALTSVALRTTSRLRLEVEAALTAGEVVRSWPMRGTLHLVAAEDLPWMLDLMASRVVAQSARRRAQLGLDSSTLAQAREIAQQALGGGVRLTRAELLACWDRAGLDTSSGRGYHLLGYLAQTGVLCLGPVAGREQSVVLIEDWVAEPRQMEREEALGELGRRYFCSHGPATVKDFTRWTNLVAADVRAAVAVARPELATLDVDGAEYLMDPRTPELLDACRSAARGVFLLPGFDEFILGYADRTAQLPAEFADRIVPGGNGMFKATVVSAGVVVGTWKRAGRASKESVEAALFRPVSAELTAAIAAVSAGLPERR
jgi:DNA glycosylase AlkZ-like